MEILILVQLLICYVINKVLLIFQVVCMSVGKHTILLFDRFNDFNAKFPNNSVGKHVICNPE